MTTLDLWQRALVTLATVAAPFLLVALVVGLLIALVQTATQLQEAVLSFVPKLAALLLLLALAGHWAFERLTSFTSMSIGQAAERTRESDTP